MDASEREEGEISDDYEIVSDDSIHSHSAEKSGKSYLPAQGLIRAISLSSLSDNYSEEEKPILERKIPSNKTAPRRIVPKKQQDLKHRKLRKPSVFHSSDKTLRARRSSYSKFKRKKRNESDSDSEGEYTNKRIIRQLKEAVHVDPDSEKTQKTLQTRLQRMINPNYSINKTVLHDDEELLALRDIALLSTQKKDEEEIVKQSPSAKDSVTLNTSTDQELTELRIIALKSAMLKKHQNRKKLKEDKLETVQDDAATSVPVESLVSAEEEQTLSPVHVVYAEEEPILSPITISAAEDEEASSPINIPSPEDIEVEVIMEQSTNNAQLLRDGFTSERSSPYSPTSVIVEIIDTAETDAVTPNMFEEIDGTIKENLVPNESNNKEKSIEEDEDIMRAMLLASMSKKITSNIKEDKTISITATAVIKTNTNNVNDNKSKTKLITTLPNAPIQPLIINLNGDSDTDPEPISGVDDKKLETDENFDKNLSLLLRQAREKVEKREEITLDKSAVKLLPQSQQVEYKRLKHKLNMLNARKKSLKINRTFHKADENRETKKNNSLLASSVKLTKKIVKIKTFPTKLKVNNVLKNKQLINNKNITATFSHEFKKVDPSIRQERLQERNRYEKLEPLMKQIDEIKKIRDEEQTNVQSLLTQLKIARNRLNSVDRHFTSLVQKLVLAKSNIDKCTHNIFDGGSTENTVPSILCTSTPKVTRAPPIISTLELSSIETETNKITPIKDKPSAISNEDVTVKNVDVIQTNETNLIKADKPSDDGESSQSIALSYESPLTHFKYSTVCNNPFLIICPYELQGVCKDAECKYQHCT